MTLPATASLPGKISDATTLRFERHLPVPIDVAWNYLTRRDLLKLWLADGVVEPEVNGKVDLEFEVDPCRDHESCHTLGTVLEWNPPTRLSYTWQEQNHAHSNEASFVIFELAPVDGGTQLILTHKRMEAPYIHMYLAGWHTHLEVLGARMENNPPPIFNDLFNQVLPEYTNLAKANWESKNDLT